jgi:XTP/dITP diphosphohydrolase
VLGRLDRAGRLDPVPGSQHWDSGAVGETLLDVVTRARAAGIDAEAALRAAVRRLEESVRADEATGATPHQVAR